MPEYELRTDIVNYIRKIHNILVPDIEVDLRLCLLNNNYIYK